MLEQIQSLDAQLLIYLNSLGSETFDGFWLFITKQTNWIPLFLLFLFVIYKKIGTKQTLYLLLFTTVLLTITNGVCDLFKHGFERLRPCNNPDINSIIRVVKTTKSFSFFSGHAANTMAVATFLYHAFKSRFKYMGLLFLWPLIFAYSRIYLGLHYPGDVLTGYFFGAVFGFLMYKIYVFLQNKYFPV